MHVSRFSRRAILDFEGVIQDKAKYFCENMERCKSKGNEINLVDAYSAFTGDVIMQYLFGFTYDHVRSDGFKENFHEAYMAVSKFSHIAIQFPFATPVYIFLRDDRSFTDNFCKLLKSLPDAANEKMNPPFAKMIRLRKVRSLNTQLSRM